MKVSSNKPSAESCLYKLGALNTLILHSFDKCKLLLHEKQESSRNRSNSFLFVIVNFLLGLVFSNICRRCNFNKFRFQTYHLEGDKHWGWRMIQP